MILKLWEVIFKNLGIIKDKFIYLVYFNFGLYNIYIIIYML